jgi:hypothetical protein
VVALGSTGAAEVTWRRKPASGAGRKWAREPSRTGWCPTVLGPVGHERLREAAGLRLRVLAAGPVGHGWLHEAASLRVHVPTSEGGDSQRDLEQARGM